MNSLTRGRPKVHSKTFQGNQRQNQSNASIEGSQRQVALLTKPIESLVRFGRLLESFSNDDGDGNENATKQ